MKLLDIVTAPWAIQPDKLIEIQDIYGRHLKGDKIDLAGLEAQMGQPLKNGEQGYTVINEVAIIPVIGVIGKRMNLLMDISGGASTELIERDLKKAMVDPEVKSILLEIDSPGGTVDGTSELGALVHSLRGDKPVVAWASGLMASAAYWIGSAADQVYMSSDTTTVGSIGVVTRHVDYSEQDKMMGVKVTNIYAGKYKVVGADNKPLSKSDHKIIQTEIDYLYTIFVDAVAKHRGVDPATVLDDMADGRVFTGQQAIDAGLVDGVSTLDAMIAAMSDGELPNPDEFSAGVHPEPEGEREAITSIIKPAKEKAMSGDKTVITKGAVLEHAPDVAEAFREEGKASIDVEAERTAAATAERERIQAVLGHSMPGCEDLVNGLAFDGTTTGPDAAVQVLKATKDAQGKIAKDLHDDGADLTKVKPGADNAVVDVDAAPSDDAPLEDRAKYAWDKDAKLQKDFGGSFDAYLDYLNADASAQAALATG